MSEVNTDLINKYKRALDIANSTKELSKYTQVIRETLYKLLQSGYVATIDEVVWAECFVNRDYFSDMNWVDGVMVLREFTKSDEQDYKSIYNYSSNNQPLITSKYIDDCEVVVIVDNNCVQISVSEYSAMIPDTHRLLRRYKIAIANDICSVVDKCTNKSMLYEELRNQLNLDLERR